MEQSAEEYAIDESIEVARAEPRVAAHSIRRNSIERMYLNPLRDEPDAAVVAAVQRFGVVGLVACAVGTGVARWWRAVKH